MYLWIDLGVYACRHPFLVVRILAPDVIIGCTFLDEHAESLQILRKVLIRTDGTVVPIRRRAVGKPTVVRTRERVEVAPLPPKTNLFHAAQRIVLPPEWETIVTFVCRRTGPVVLDPRPQLYDKRQVSLTNGFADMWRTNRSLCESLTSAQASGHSLKIKSWVSLTLHLIRCSKLTYLRTTFLASPQNVSALLRSVCLILKSLQFQSLMEMSNAGHLSAMHTWSYLCKVMSPLVSRSLSSRHQWTISTCRIWTRSYKSVFAKCFLRSPVCGTEILASSWTPNIGLPCERMRTEIRNAVTAMKEDGVIRDAKLKWARPLVLTPKSDGSMRFCVDDRRLNQLTLRDSYSLSRMQGCLDNLGEATFFTTLDCNSGYWQILVAEEDRAMTAFTCHAGCLEFCRMPFCLCNAPAMFQRTVYMLLYGYRCRTCLVYLDDIIVFRNTAEEHVDHVREVLTVLKEAGFSLKLKKCMFFAKFVDDIGRVIRPGRLEVATKNTDAMKCFKEPIMQTELRSFPGFCDVYGRFVPNFARTAAPLNAFLRKGGTTELPPFNEEQSVWCHG